MPDLGATLADARARAEDLMTDTCVIKRANGTSSVDPDTLTETPNYDTVLTSKCKLQLASMIARPSQAGERTIYATRPELHLPTGTTGQQVGDVVTVTAVGALSDVNLVGRHFKLIGPPAKSYATALRIEVEEFLG